MMIKKQYRTVFISDVHLWHLKNQWDKLVEFLDSVSFENLVIVWDFIDDWQLSWFWKWRDKENKVLDYINNLARTWVKITYIQWNHDRKLKCSDTIHIENMAVMRDMYYKSLKWKTYYITHWDCLDWVNRNWNNWGQLWSICFWLLLKIEGLWNKNVLSCSYLSFAERFEEWVKKVRMPDSRITRKIEKFAKNLDCEWMIIGHFHIARHYEVNWIDYYNTWDWLRNCSAVLEDLKWDLNLFHYKP
jgi:UDP-2,3-diacylglucosamine pyrophosphatase LpxH